MGVKGSFLTNKGGSNYGKSQNNNSFISQNNLQSNSDVDINKFGPMNIVSDQDQLSIHKDNVSAGIEDIMVDI